MAEMRLQGGWAHSTDDDCAWNVSANGVDAAEMCVRDSMRVWKAGALGCHSCAPGGARVGLVAPCRGNETPVWLAPLAACSGTSGVGPTEACGAGFGRRAFWL